jgi:spermidine/putrescine transport system substrate-binding protein
MALKSLGFSANSERPEELDAALRRLLDIREQVIFLDDYDVTSAGPVLANGEAVYAVGYALDVLEGQELNASIEYVLPTEGALMWGDNFAIPANSPNKATAELFINFLLQAEVSAQIANYNRYATPNEAAFPLIEPEILHNPVIFPGREELNSAEIILPLSPEGERMYARAWELFIAGADAGGLREH